MDNINLSVTLAYRFNKEGFEEWNYKPKRMQRSREFNFMQSQTKSNIN